MHFVHLVRDVGTLLWPGKEKTQVLNWQETVNSLFPDSIIHMYPKVVSESYQTKSPAHYKWYNGSAGHDPIAITC